MGVIFSLLNDQLNIFETQRQIKKVSKQKLVISAVSKKELLDALPFLVKTKPEAVLFGGIEPRPRSLTFGSTVEFQADIGCS